MHKLAIWTMCRYKALAAQRDRGATAAEYALIILLVTGAIVVAVTALGTQITAVFNGIVGNLGGGGGDTP
jgi:Flp pilus assembly pilin Flp